MSDDPAHGHRRTWSIGEAARACGLTVRTLDHYDRIGLVAASSRTAAGHRRYRAADLRRLDRVTMLRRLGVRLADVGAWLGGDAVGQGRAHLDALDAELRRGTDRRRRLARLLDAADDDARTGRAAGGDLLDVMEVMVMDDGQLSAEQAGRLARERQARGFEGTGAWRAEATAAVAALAAAHDAGVDPAAPQVQALVVRIRGLRRRFAGDDAGVALALRRGHAGGEGSIAELRAVIPDDPDLRAYWRRARAAADGS